MAIAEEVKATEVMEVQVMVVVMILAPGLVMVGQVDYMEVEQVIVAVVGTILMQGRKDVSCCRCLSFLLAVLCRCL